METSEPPPEAAPPLPARPPRRWRWIAGGCASATFLSAAAAGTLVSLGFQGQGPLKWLVPPPPRVVTFDYRSAPTELGVDWRERYVPFSFHYPITWERAREPGTRNFIKLERKLRVNGKAFTQENFAIGYFRLPAPEADAPPDAPERALRDVVRAFKAQFAQSPRYRKLSEGPLMLAGITGYEFRFETRAVGTRLGDVPLWGRVILLPTAPDRGLSLVMLASNLAPEVQSPDDLGIKGELPIILTSFRIESDPEPEAPEKPAAKEANGPD